MKTCLHTLTQAAKKHCDNLGYFSVLYSMQAIYSRSYKAEKKKDNFYSSGWTSAVWVSVVRVQNLLISDERTSESFLPWKSAENQKWWHSTTQIWEVLLIGHVARDICLNAWPSALFVTISINMTLLNLSITCSVR